MYTISPMDELARLNPDLILNLSASPFSASRSGMKVKVFTGKAAKHKLPLFMSNQVGGNTELLFDGGSMVIGPTGKIVDHLGSFCEEVRTYNLEDIINSAGEISYPDHPYIEMIHRALVMGTRDYFFKSGFTKAIVGLSGGIDSAVVLAIAAEALGSANVRALLMPSMYSSQHSVDDAVGLANNLGVKYDIINIEESYRSITSSLEPLFKGMQENVT
ncbi:MAG: NAD(+) synthase [Bacteroidales bacterium]